MDHTGRADEGREGTQNPAVHSGHGDFAGRMERQRPSRADIPGATDVQNTSTQSTVKSEG